jgi:O-antigen polymerase
MGGVGWLVPSNIALWFASSVFVVLAMLKVLQAKKIKYSFLNTLLGLLFLGVLGMGSIRSHIGYQEFLFYFLLLFNVWLFFLAAFQFSLNLKAFNTLVMSVVILGGVQAAIGFVQYFDYGQVFYNIVAYEPFAITGRPTGSFQQVNMMSSFLSVSLLGILYLTTIKSKKLLSFKARNYLLLLSCFIFVAFFLTGSRAGIVALLGGFLTFLLVNFRVVKPSFAYLIGWLLIAFLMAVLTFAIFQNVPVTSNAFDSTVLSKFERVASGSDVRIDLYTSAIKLFIQSPFLGYGIGNYDQTMVEFYSHLTPSPQLKAILGNIIHPHNELLFWMLQSGVITLILVVTFIYFYIKGLFKEKRKAIVLFLLMPILIHSQLSFPFTLSSLHLFLLITLLAFGSTGIRSYTFQIDKTRLIRLSLLPVVFVYFFVSTLLAHVMFASIDEIYYYQKRLFLYKQEKYVGNELEGYFKYASINPLTRPFIRQEMNRMFDKAIKQENKYDLNQYILWSNKNAFSVDVDNERLSLALKLIGFKKNDSYK